MARKLNKKELMIVSRILEDVNFKYYIDTLLSNKVDNILSIYKGKEHQAIILIGDIFAFVIQNINRAEDNIDELIMSYKGIENKEDMNEMDGDEYIKNLKEVFTAGVPSVMKDYVDITEIKKKLSNMTKQQIKKT